MTERYLTNGAAAKAVDVPPSSLRRWARQGLLKPTFKTPGGHYKWDLDDLKRQLAKLQGDG